MMNINEWRLLKESIGGGLTLGLSRPNVIGGPIGSRFSEEEFKVDDADFDDEDEDQAEDDDDYDGEQLEDDDDEGMEGDLIGSTSKDDGPPKSFPPDDSDEEEELGGDDFGGDEDFEGGDSELDDLAAGLDSADFGGEGGDDFGDMDDMDAQEVSPDDMLGDDFGGGGEDDLAGSLGAGMGDEMGGKDIGGGDDMDFLNDIDPEMAGMGPEEDGELDDLAAGLDSAEFGDEMGDEFGDEMGDEFGDEMGDEFGDEDPFADAAPDKKMSFQKKYMHKDMHKDKDKDKDKDREHYNCEQDEFLNSLAKNAHNPANKKNKSGLKEDSMFSLINPNDVFGEPNAGQVGFAPSGRIGSIGGGYTQDDISNMPFLGESTNHRGGRRRAPVKNKYPTINEWLERKTKASTKTRSKKRR